jgi:hypothetical protein
LPRFFDHDGGQAAKLQSPFEFVYLDEVSVFSLLASKKGHVVESLQESSSHEVQGEASGQLTGLVAGAGARVLASERKETQVIRKAIIQSRFVELQSCTKGDVRFDLEKKVSRDAWPTNLAALKSDRQLCCEIDIQRGDLLALRIEVRPEEIFAVHAVGSAILPMIEKERPLFGGVEGQEIETSHAVMRVLDALMAGLVPLRGRVVDYSVATIDGKPFLVHQEAIKAVQTNQDGPFHLSALDVVAVLDRGLFWKDLRRVLFEHQEYVAFCRVHSGDLLKEWNPLKLAPLLGSMNPALGKALERLPRDVPALFRLGITQAMDSAAQPDHSDRIATLVQEIGKRIGKDQSKDLTLTRIGKEMQRAGPDFPTNLATRRKVIENVLRIAFPEGLEAISNDELAALRAKYLDAPPTSTRFSAGGQDAVDDASRTGQGNAASNDPLILECEVIALYW